MLIWDHVPSKSIISLIVKLLKRRGSIVTKPIQELLNKYKNDEDTFKIQPGLEAIKAIGESFKKISGINLDNIVNGLLELANQLKSMEPKIAELIEQHSRIGWAFDLTDRSSYDLGVDLYGMSDDELNKYLLNFYVRNSCENLYLTMDNLASNLSEGYSNQVDLMKRSLIADKEYYKLCYYSIYSIIEHQFISILTEGRMNSPRIINKKNVTDYGNKLDNQSVILSAVFSECIKLLTKELEYQNFSEDDILLTRHSLIHGRYNPNDLNFSGFVKLVVLASTFSGIPDTTIKIF